MNNKMRHQPPSGKNHKIIRCECGAEILLMPDVKEMERTIAAHAESHAQKEKDPKKAKVLFEQIQDSLIQQVLIMASENGENINTYNQNKGKKNQ